MLLGVIADDFTGASDIANTIAKGLPGQGGLRTVQYLGLPSAAADAEVEAGVIALKSRSIDAAVAVEQSLDALKWLLDQGCEQIVFKYCSTSIPRQPENWSGRGGARQRACSEGCDRLPCIPRGRTHRISRASLREGPSP